MAEQDSKVALLSKLAEFFHLVLITLGVIIVVLAGEAGLKYKDLSLPAGDPITRLGMAVFGLLVIGLGLYLSKHTPKTGANLPSAKDYAVKIIIPSENEKGAKMTVKGSIQKTLPPGFHLWVFRVYDDNRFYPLRECTINTDGDLWEAPNCDIGGKQGDIRHFSIYLVGPDGAALISYVKEASQRFTPIRDELVAKRGTTDVPYLPSILMRTADMIQCATVRVEKQ